MKRKLQDLIYKYNSTIVTDAKTPKKIVEDIEAVRSGSSLTGFIFRPAFASDVEFNEYTEEDWMAIFAQWSVTFGWTHIYEVCTDDNPKDVLSDYFASREFDSIDPLITEEKRPVVKTKKYLLELTKLLIGSKAVLTDHQKNILVNMPTKVLKKAYEDTIIPIRETRTFVVSRMLEKDSSFNPFRSISDIVPILIENYAVKGTYEDTEVMLNKTILAKVKVKLPTSMKRKVITTLISGYKNEYGIAELKKYQDFFKKLLRQVAISNSLEKTISQYPEFKNVLGLVYSKIKTNRTAIEAYRKKGLLEEAFLLEMRNPGSMVRNILFYLRNEVGDTYPTKESTKKNDGFMNPIYVDRKTLDTHIATVGMGNMDGKKVRVKTDISHIIETDDFFNVLLSANPKLLIQLKSLLNTTKYHKEQESKTVNKNNIYYEVSIPALKMSWVEKVIALVDKAYMEIKVQNNINLGKVYISDYFKDIKVNFSGRLDVSTNTSGKFLPLGSKVKIENMFGDDVLIRYGVSWKSPENNKHLSICIDPSLHIKNGNFKNTIVNWQAPELFHKDKIVVSSSGDITDCTFEEWSTELMDIDVNQLREVGSTDMYTAVINYHAPQGNLAEVDTHIFVNVINRKDRVISGRTVKVPLDEMDYSYQITEDSQAQVGLRFDLENSTVQVLKTSIENIYGSSTGSTLQKQFEEGIENMPEYPTTYDSLMKAISPSQIVTTKDEADTVIDEKFDNTKIQNILF